jgi:hypothetical protein
MMIALLQPRTWMGRSNSLLENATALAQYPQGRSKVQVAVLSGYAATGGGFNNYLGALRSRGLMKGDGDSLRITETGIRELGS